MQLMGLSGGGSGLNYGEISQKIKGINMRKAATTKERLYMSNIKELPCCVCGHSGPSEVHHLVNGYRLGNMFTIPLCYECHRGDNGFSGKNRNSWDKSLDNQLRLLAKTCKKLGISTPEYKSKIVRRSER